MSVPRSRLDSRISPMSDGQIIASASSTPIPNSLTLLSAPFLPQLPSSSPASFVVWTFVVTYWKLRETHDCRAIASVIASRLRRRIQDDWYLVRRHRSPDFDFFRSQWMPLDVHFHRCTIDYDHDHGDLSISFGHTASSLLSFIPGPIDRVLPEFCMRRSLR